MSASLWAATVTAKARRRTQHFMVMVGKASNKGMAVYAVVTFEYHLARALSSVCLGFPGATDGPGRLLAGSGGGCIAWHWAHFYPTTCLGHFQGVDDILSSQSVVAMNRSDIGNLFYLFTR
jgi:hypothetical protein